MTSGLNFAARNKRMKLSVSGAFDGTVEQTFGATVKASVFTLPQDAKWFRIRFLDATYTLKFYYAPTSAIGNGYIPRLANGTDDTSGTSWIAGTFNGAGADLPPESNPGGATTTLTATNATSGGDLWSDWMACDGLLARTDGGIAGERLLAIRSQVITGTSRGLQIPTAGGILADALGTSTNFGSPSTNITPGLSVDDFVANAFRHVAEIQILSNVAGYTVLYCGSSILQGSTTTNNRLSFVRYACKQIASDLGVPVVPVWNRTATADHATITTAALKQIAALKPNVVLIQVGNRNDAITAAQQDVNWRLDMQMVDATHRVGGVPILVTTTPWPAAQAPTAVEDGYRQINNIRARNSGLPYFDYDALMTDGGSPARLQAQFNDSGDLTHPGNAGHLFAGITGTAAIPALQPILQRALFF